MSGPLPPSRRDAGFTLIEALAVLLLTGVLVSAMTLVTGQWMKSWNRGAVALQRVEMLSVALDRMAMDIQGAIAMPASGRRRFPSFLGDERSVRFVHPPFDRAAPEGLEIVDYTATRDGVLTRSRAPFDPDAPVGDAQTSGATPLLREPFRAAFAFLDPRDVWVTEWRDERLPEAVRVTVSAPDAGLPTRVFTIAIHASLPAGCASARTWVVCDAFASNKQAPTQLEEFNRRNPDTAPKENRL